jgi:hypothetical protein
MNASPIETEDYNPPLMRYSLGSDLWQQMISEGKIMIPLIAALYKRAIEATPPSDLQSASVEANQPSIEESEFAITWAGAVLQREALGPEIRRVEAISKYVKALDLAKRDLLSELQLLASEGDYPQLNDDIERQVSTLESARNTLTIALQPIKEISFEALRYKVLERQKRALQNETPYEKHMREFRATAEGQAKLAAMARRDELEHQQMLQIKASIDYLERTNRK